MGIRDLAAKAKQKLRGDIPQIDEGVDRIGDKFDNASGDRFGTHTDRTQEAVNERIDDFTGGDRTRQNRDPMP